MSSPVCFEALCWRHLKREPWPYAKIIRFSYGNMPRWTFSAHTLQRQESGRGRLLAHWCLTQLGPDGSRSANRPVIQSAQRNGSLKSNVTLYSTFALDKKKEKEKGNSARPRRNRTDWGLNNFIWVQVPSVPPSFCWMGLMLLIRQTDFQDSKVALICQYTVHSSVRSWTQPLKLKCHISCLLNTSYCGLLWRNGQMFFLVCMASSS